ncbi:hypothetical protein [Intrasporangium sp.]|uniref:hypothetical protein n=1 Tax=Intrasporangium sp. TaxID=1925024 RepID=UPI0032218F12
MPLSIKAVGGFVVGLAAVAGAVFAGMQVFAPPSSSHEPPAEPATSLSVTLPVGPTTSSRGAPWPRNSTAVFDAGTCLDGDTPIACDRPHNREVIAVQGDCDPTRLIRFAGGDPSTEVLRAAFSTSQIPGTEVCVAQLDGNRSGSLAKILATRAGDFARLCFQDVPQTVVGCDQPHTREAVLVRAPTDTRAINCLQAASRYVDTDFSRFTADLEVSQETGPTGATTCWIQARGNNHLTQSIRSIRTGALPLEPGR